MIVREKCGAIPPGDAILLIRVDESRKKRRIFLPHGVPGPNVPVIFL